MTSPTSWIDLTRSANHVLQVEPGTEQPQLTLLHPGDVLSMHPGPPRPDPHDEPGHRRIPLLGTHDHVGQPADQLTVTSAYRPTHQARNRHQRGPQLPPHTQETGRSARPAPACGSVGFRHHAQPRSTFGTRRSLCSWAGSRRPPRERGHLVRLRRLPVWPVMSSDRTGTSPTTAADPPPRC